MKVKLAPSILSADFARLESQIKEVEEEGADMLHIDIMDGHFVPNITIGPVVVKGIRPVTSLPFDVHLMISHPRKYIRSFADSGADLITFHVECEDAKADAEGVLDVIMSCGKKAGITLKPNTPLSALERYLERVNLLLVMSVNPGFGGQGFIDSSLDKIREARKMIDERGYKTDLEVDGGINAVLAPKVVEAGANVLVAGNAVFKGEIRSNMRALIRSVGNPWTKR
jgi:ribulose-phosphate 3-epimerase